MLPPCGARGTLRLLLLESLHLPKTASCTREMDRAMRHVELKHGGGLNGSHHESRVEEGGESGRMCTRHGTGLGSDTTYLRKQIQVSKKVDMVEGF